MSESGGYYWELWEDSGTSPFRRSEVKYPNQGNALASGMKRLDAYIMGLTDGNVEGVAMLVLNDRGEVVSESRARRLTTNN